ncbi:SKIP/SNW domain-containing protein [Syncephalis pseudoplumigaleata]|uniref:Pre-mRNA-processing protein 45 n=1 Tax=Syncephalis pseudoplumigaleata TaxID=1712513 RepID=A0A4P9YZ68_9FUNG|nr:SKIP/SNW domain-containing protein [Syncephalis pseudoplumigaleata]|eukprot:RKP25416.1 SKIP/SNW domain-containing protein [Syncephalis pseudoplumigaleata]
MADNPRLKLLSMTFDVTPPSLMNLIVTDIGMIPCESVSMVLREYNALPKPVYVADSSKVATAATAARSTPASDASSVLSTAITLVSSSNAKKVPPYGQRQHYLPRAEADFGDGGAFPEIHIPQYPLGMGRKKDASGKTLALQVDAEGNVRYDAVVRQGHDKNRLVQTQYRDLVPLRNRVDAGEVSLDMPDEEEIQQTTDRTREALEKIITGKISAAKPKNVVVEKKEPTYIRYTPGQQADSQNSGAKQRIIRMSEMPVDPMMPAKFKHTKIPQAPPSPPPPVLHSPPRKLTAEQQKEWVIPPCVSNWKNPKGFTIALDKRLAADGRGLQEVTINDNFANFAEALTAAERHAREEIRLRSKMQQVLAQKEKMAKEENLRLLAQRAREERTEAMRGSGGQGKEAAADVQTEEDREAEEMRERETLRRERARERERDNRLSRMGAEQRAKHLAREQGRDISEKIALGLAKPTLSKESMFDQRLYNQSAGIDSGFRGDDSYDVYDKPLFRGTASASIYRPTAGQDDEQYGGGNAEEIGRMLGNERFNAAGLGASRETLEGGRRDGPVQFEKERTAPQLDPFGVDKFLSEAKQGKRGADDTALWMLTRCIKEDGTCKLSGISAMKNGMQ